MSFFLPQPRTMLSVFGESLVLKMALSVSTTAPPADPTSMFSTGSIRSEIEFAKVFAPPRMSVSWNG